VTVSRFGVDYSFTPPTVQELRSAGVTFVCRYLSHQPSKNLTRSEAEALSAAGIDIVANWETDKKGFMTSVDATPARDAESALAQARSCGMPDGRPIYFSLDVDPRGFSAGEWDRVFTYLDGVAAVIGRANVGIYGGFLAIEKALGARKAQWGWQTSSWRGRHPTDHDLVWSDLAHIQQFDHELPLGHGQVDHNRAVTDDFGQWRIGDDMPLNDADKQWLRQEIRDAINDHADKLFRWADHGGGGSPTGSLPGHPFNHKAILDRIDQLDQRLPGSP